MKRLLTPALNPAGLIFAVNAIYALTQAILTHYHVAWGLSPAQLATVDAFAVAWARTQVTPVADPRVPGKVIADVADLAASLPGKLVADLAPKPATGLGKLRLTPDERVLVDRLFPAAVSAPATTGSGPVSTQTAAPVQHTATVSSEPVERQEGTTL